MYPSDFLQTKCHYAGEGEVFAHITQRWACPARQLENMEGEGKGGGKEGERGGEGGERERGKGNVIRLGKEERVGEGSIW